MAQFHKEARIGTIGWGYGDWNGYFYPSEMQSRDALPTYSKVFDCVEIDTTFYGVPRESTVQNWAKSTPPNFVFSPKTPRFITHDLGLIDAEEPFRKFVETMSHLGEKLGPILLQFPPSFTIANLPQIRSFLPVLKTLDHSSARFALEVRHRSLLTDELYDLLREYQVAFVSIDYVGMPRRFELTTDFVYVRLLGKHDSFVTYHEVQGKRQEDVEKWAEVFKKNQDRFEKIFIYSNNDYEGHSPSTSNRMKEQLGLPVVDPVVEVQGSLF